MPSSRRTTRSAASAGDAGAGLIGGIAGVIAFLGFLLFSVQLLTTLYTTSVVSAVATDAASSLARSPDASGRASIEARARDSLGGLGPSAGFEWRIDDHRVRLRIRVRPHRWIPLGLSGMVGPTVIDRTVEIRVERLR